jgi:hypothetical protein
MCTVIVALRMTLRILEKEAARARNAIPTIRANVVPPSRRSRSTDIATATKRFDFHHFMLNHDEYSDGH